MDGILLINKPSGFTSHRVVDIIRQITNIKKVGHAGTLDPMASGLLILLLGKATKSSKTILEQNKRYLAQMKFFEKTDTGDSQGKVTEATERKVYSLSKIKDTINLFNKKSYWQSPPIYSAIKVKGKKLYEYALSNQEVSLPSRLVRIDNISLLKYDPDPEENTLSLDITCSKGTYIRSLVSDIAWKLGTIAFLIKLKRIGSGNFNIKDAVDLQDIDYNKIEKNLIRLN